MSAFLIVLGLIALGAGMVAYAVHRHPMTPPLSRDVQDTAWSDPITPANDRSAIDDPFAHAPPPTQAHIAQPAAPVEPAAREHQA